MIQQVPALKAFNFSVADITPILDAIKAFGQSLSPPSTNPTTSSYHRMSALGAANSIVLSLRNPMIDNSHLGLTLPSEASATSNTNASAKGIFTIADRGNINITPAHYMTAVRAIQPDVTLLTAEEIPANASRSRTDKAIRRNLQWLGAAIAARKAEFGADHAALAPEERSLFFAPLEGGIFADKRASYNKFLEELLTNTYPGDSDAAYRAFDGYLVGGIGSIADSDMRKQMIASSLAGLPEEKPRAVNFIGYPLEILDAISSGIDLTAVTYPVLMTDAGLAISSSFTLEDLEKTVNKTYQPLDTTELYPDLDGAYMNLRNDEYREDPRPMVENCTCYACRTHTRAYIHHLLNAHEMLAEVLLMTHNAHQYGALFQAMRDNIAAGESQFQRWLELAYKAFQPHEVDNMSKKKVKPKDMRDDKDE